jgi:hypothetical protein
MMPATVSSQRVRNSIKEWIAHTGPCLSIVLSNGRTRYDNQEQRGAIRHAMEVGKAKLAEAALSEQEIATFLNPVRDALESRTEISKDSAVAVYRSVEGLWDFDLPYAADPVVRLDNHFWIRPLFRLLEESTEFYILALSQKHTRLIRCTSSTAEEVDLPDSVPKNLFDFNQHAQPDHRLENRAQGGQVGKRGPHVGMVVAFGTGSDADQKDEYLHHYFKEIDKQLNVVLRPDPLPMVVAAVDYEVALYHRVSEYPMLVEGGVHGAPDGLKGGELQARALDVLQGYNGRRADKALADYEKAGAERMTTTLTETLRRAYDGRVLYLFIDEKARQFGTFDESTLEVKISSDEQKPAEDLVNLAALQTILHAGEVFSLPGDKMPGKCSIAAMLRY